MKFKIYKIYSEIEGKGWEEETDNTNKERAIECARDTFKWHHGNATVHVVKVTGEWGNWEYREEVYTKKAEKKIQGVNKNER